MNYFVETMAAAVLVETFLSNEKHYELLKTSYCIETLLLQIKFPHPWHNSFLVLIV